MVNDNATHIIVFAVNILSFKKYHVRIGKVK